MRHTTQNSFKKLVLLNERTSTVLGSEKFRYGFNSQEKDDEVAGQGNSYTAEFWQYDSRLGRRWNIDPVFKEFESPYACIANNPIWFTDPDGADSTKVGNTWFWKVEHGDDYAKISKRTGVPFETLKNSNEQDPLNLQSGSLLSLTTQKVHFVYESKTPNIFGLTVQALIGNPEWTSLNYNGKNSPETSKNRNLVCPRGTCGAGLECDEFPYASSSQGGEGAVRKCVPPQEQRIQGGQLSAIYRTMNMGDQFSVVPVPDQNKQSPKPDPVPVLDPGWKPIPLPKVKFRFNPNPTPVGGPILIGPALPAGALMKVLQIIF